MDIRLNYGKGSVNLNIPEDTVAGIYEPKYIPGFVDLQGELRRAISHPIGSDPLTRKLHTDSKVVIVVDDITRPVPNAKILPVIIDYLAEQGISPENITVLVGLGIHPPMRKETLAELPGSSEERVRLVNHTPDDDSALTLVGTTSFGTQVRLNNRFLEADVRIVLGDIEYHQFCGYGGGAKSLFPGIADRASIQANHARQFTDGARKGLWTGNPVRQEIEEVGQMVRVDLAVNVVLNHRHEVVGCYAGDIQQTFLEGISLVKRMYKDTISHPVDLVITSPGGYPHDIDLYQSQKAINAASAVVKPHGTIILVAECRQGHGSDKFYQWMQEAESVQDIIQRHHQGFELGGHKAYQFARALHRYDIYLHSAQSDSFVEEFFLTPITVEEIESKALKSPRIAVLPFATVMNVELQEIE